MWAILLSAGLGLLVGFLSAPHRASPSERTMLQKSWPSIKEHFDRGELCGLTEAFGTAYDEYQTALNYRAKLINNGRGCINVRYEPDSNLSDEYNSWCRTELTSNSRTLNTKKEDIQSSIDLALLNKEPATPNRTLAWRFPIETTDKILIKNNTIWTTGPLEIDIPAVDFLPFNNFDSISSFGDLITVIGDNTLRVYDTNFTELLEQSSVSLVTIEDSHVYTAGKMISKLDLAGKFIWGVSDNTEFTNIIVSSSKLYYGAIYTTEEDLSYSKLVAVNEDGTKDWEIFIGILEDIEYLYAFGDTIFVGTVKFLHAIDVTSGNRRWAYLYFLENLTPTIIEDNIYIPTGTTSKYGLTILDRDTGAVKEEFKFGCKVSSYWASSDAWMAGCYTGEVYRDNPTGGYELLYKANEMVAFVYDLNYIGLCSRYKFYQSLCTPGTYTLNKIEQSFF